MASLTSDEGIELFKAFWDGCEPFYGGKSTVPNYQTSHYYTQPDSGVHCRIHFPKAGADDLAALYAACKPAQFGRSKETVLDDTYRKAKKMDLDSFAPLFDPRSLGILEQVSRGLLTGNRGPGITEMELYKLNVYGEGDFFKPHQDTPRSESIVGSLVVVLPTQHEGGQLCFVRRSVLHPHTIPRATPESALVKFINDKSTLPEGGCLGCGLVHGYVYNADQPINALLDYLKGADQILAMI
ncbi:hypothetical protein J3R83DRAFT_10520 [Lanmaoa asiatica]|nr:hypothetical protein J3R83DRAFT_10520 [Lanmaoa asiatica]